jgi:hypothetical protein
LGGGGVGFGVREFGLGMGEALELGDSGWGWERFWFEDGRSLGLGIG